MLDETSQADGAVSSPLNALKVAHFDFLSLDVQLKE